jgi:hypothetical protein
MTVPWEEFVVSDINDRMPDEPPFDRRSNHPHSTKVRLTDDRRYILRYYSETAPPAGPTSRMADDTGPIGYRSTNCVVVT